ncbi:MAG: hypothetical protein M1819_004067 [Sarea resinae]|nr:MAG: hypothetical protein M1819_004067 [Sarea resinae]
MVDLKEVRDSNQKLASSFPELTALFVGATSGIGESILKQFAKSIEKPTAYIVGRSEKAASQLLESLHALNPKGVFNFIETDVSTLKNVDGVCDRVKGRVEKLNLLFLSAGYISFVGRQATPDDVDASLALRYYGRARFIQNLLPIMSSPVSRVVSVLAGGKEGKMVESDLYLRHNYSIMNAAVHSATMMTLAMDRFAAENPSISFVHVFPGLVNTPVLSRGLPAPAAIFMKYVGIPILSLFALSYNEAGERELFYATSARYPPAGNRSSAVGVVLGPKVEVAEGCDGAQGTGLYLLDWNGEIAGDEKLLTDFKTRGLSDTVWAHTLEVFENAAQ